MANERLNIPEKLKVGFQNREGTYSGKLAYVVYLNKKGNIAKQTSWAYWIDHKIPTEDYDNVPTEGFVLNKKVGDYVTEWGHRRSYCRVYDPRGFEFEITFENLLYILENCDCTKGKGLEGEFVYAWEDKNLVLLPVRSPDYAATKALMDKHENITGRNIKIGGLYRAKTNGTVKEEDMGFVSFVYLGKFNFVAEEKKYFVFYCEENKRLYTYTGIANNFDYCIDEDYYSADKIADITDMINNNYSVRGLEGGFSKLYISRTKNLKNVTSVDELNKRANDYHDYGYLYRLDDTSFAFLSSKTERLLDGMNEEEYEMSFFEKYNNPYLINNIRYTYRCGSYRGCTPQYSPKLTAKYLESLGKEYKDVYSEYKAHLNNFSNKAKKCVTGFYVDKIFKLSDSYGLYSNSSSRQIHRISDIDITSLVANSDYCPKFDFVAEYKDGKKTLIPRGKGVVTITNNLPKNLI